MPAEEKAARADFVIRTDGTFAETDQQIEKIWGELRALEDCDDSGPASDLAVQPRCPSAESSRQTSISILSWAGAIRSSTNVFQS